MKEQLISFETAKLAHDKGFRYRSDFMYDRNNEIQNTPSIKHLFNKGKLKEIKRPIQVFAPTQSLLQTWLREVHNVEVISEPTYRSNLTKKYTVSYYFQGIEFRVKEEDKSFDTIFKYFTTYEEALEKGLLEALKLI